jgi:alkylhydroperoxidase/carboxymuconolactone decarboxylase family protein YurZ
MGISVAELRQVAVDRLAAVPDGEPLDALARTLVDFGVKASPAALDRHAIEASVSAAYAAGATPAQLAEVLTLVSALGVHSLMTSASIVVREAQKRGLAVGAADEQLWTEKVGTDAYWASFERFFPGFLHDLLALAPRTFRGFFEYCALPFQEAKVRSRTKELIAIATDASPCHRFAPGFRLHLENAIALGIGRRAILDAIDIAAACPTHDGVAGE